MRLMESCPAGSLNERYSFGMKVTVLRMAELSPSAAFDWIKSEWPDADNMEIGLNQAWDLVSPEWAHQDPLSLLDVWIDAESRLNDPFQIDDDELFEML